MNIEPALFYIFSGILVFAALAVIVARNSVHAALFLVLAFFSSAAVWLLLEAEFLAIVLVLVYIGAVMVLFLFVVMMLDVNHVPLREGFLRYLPIGGLVGALILLEMVLVVGPKQFGLDRVPAPDPRPADYSNTTELGQLLYTVYVYPFEIAGAILLLSIVAAIALTMRRRPQTRYQNPAEQMRVRREDRIRMVSMPAEPRQPISRAGDAAPEKEGDR
ncbi:MAG: NADH-quinone oxidoreductase subunit J [Gammaproteobacteria bacterium]|jgi:NADH-quinone oxidoreductase subunit J|nr:NADH-quinone oxidoreductase subunit J [Gammaproteobacteria bacterium]